MYSVAGRIAIIDVKAALRGTTWNQRRNLIVLSSTAIFQVHQSPVLWSWVAVLLEMTLGRHISTGGGVNAASGLSTVHRKLLGNSNKVGPWEGSHRVSVDICLIYFVYLSSRRSWAEILLAQCCQSYGHTFELSSLLLEGVPIDGQVRRTTSASANQIALTP